MCEAALATPSTTRRWRQGRRLNVPGKRTVRHGSIRRRERANHNALGPSRAGIPAQTFMWVVKGANPTPTLTPRERLLVEQILAGRSNKAIALMASISEQTVRNQLTAVFRKLAVSSRLELAVKLRPATILTRSHRKSSESAAKWLWYICTPARNP